MLVHCSPQSCPQCPVSLWCWYSGPDHELSTCLLSAGPSVFSHSQKRVLLRYYEELDMKSTHRRNEDLMRQAVVEAQTSIERVKVSCDSVHVLTGTNCVC